MCDIGGQPGFYMTGIMIGRERDEYKLFILMDPARRNDPLKALAVYQTAVQYIFNNKAVKGIYVDIMKTDANIACLEKLGFIKSVDPEDITMPGAQTYYVQKTKFTVQDLKVYWTPKIFFCGFRGKHRPAIFIAGSFLTWLVALLKYKSLNQNVIAMMDKKSLTVPLRDSPLQEDEKRWWEPYYDQHAPKINAVIRRLVNNDEQAQAILEESFVCLYNAGTILKPDHELYFLLITARKLCLNVLKHGKIQEVDLPMLAELTAHTQTWLLSLPENIRKTIRMCFMEGFDPVEWTGKQNAVIAPKLMEIYFSMQIVVESKFPGCEVFRNEKYERQKLPVIDLKWKTDQSSKPY